METAELSPEEIEMGEKHGVIEAEKEEESKEEEQEEEEEDKQEEGKDDESKEDQEEEPEEEGTEEKESKDEDQEKPEENVSDEIDLSDVSEETIKKYNPNEKAIYHKWKKDKKKRQAATDRADHFQIQSQTKDKEIAKLKEQLESNKSEDSSGDDEEFITKKESAQMAEDAVEKRFKDADDLKTQAQETTERWNKEALDRYDNYEDMAKIADQFMATEEGTRYAKKLMVRCDDLDAKPGETGADLLYDIGLIAKGKGFGSKPKEEALSAEGKEKAKKIIKNATKRPSVAAASGDGGSSHKSDEELTGEEIGRMSHERFRKLPDHIKKKALMGDI